MKIEAGKEYVTRGGQRARIYATDGAGEWSVHGAVFDPESYGWLRCAWTDRGSLSGNGLASQLDLVPTKRTVFVNLYPEAGSRHKGQYVYFADQRLAVLQSAADSVAVAVPIEIEE